MAKKYFKRHTCCWRERVVVGQIILTAFELGWCEFKRSWANCVAPERNLEPEGKSRRTWNLVRSENSRWNFPCWAENERDANISPRRADFRVGLWNEKYLISSVSLYNLTEFSPKLVVKAAPTHKKTRIFLVIPKSYSHKYGIIHELNNNYSAKTGCQLYIMITAIIL